jgi:Spy/CpxP family protein refolding chaperone
MRTWTKGIVAGLLAGVVTLGSLPAVAGPYDSNINRVEMEQEHRIQQGLHSGRLTPGEFRRLENQQARIRDTEAQMRAHGRGRLTPGQKAQLGQMQERASRNIYRLKHNNYRAGYYGRGNCRPVSMVGGWHR